MAGCSPVVEGAVSGGCSPVVEGAVSGGVLTCSGGCCVWRGAHL